MRWQGPPRGEVVTAAVCAAWAAPFLVAEAPETAVVLPLVALAAAVSRRHPLVAAFGLCALWPLTWWLGASTENQALLPLWLTAAYALGRWASVPEALAALGIFELVVFAHEQLGAADMIFALVLTLAPWAFGRLVRRRTLTAARARERAEALAADDPAVLAERAVAQERARLAGQALHTVRRAVSTMQQRAVDAESDLAADALRDVKDHGRAAVTELRSLLGLLRSETDADPRGPAVCRRRPWVSDLGIPGALAVLWFAELAVGNSGPEPVRLALGVAFVVVVGLRRTDPAVASLLAAVATAVAVPLDLTLADDFALVLAGGLLAWSAAVDGRARSWGALALLAGLTVLDMHLGRPGNEGVTLAGFALPAVAGHLWAERDRAGRSAETEAEALRAVQEAAARRAVHAERLRLARELHDVVSSAVGVMVLQAGAALAQRDRDRDRARAAVRAVQRAGVEALSELDVLFGLLDAGAVGATGLAASSGGDLGRPLDDLVQRMRSGGLAVDVRVRGDLAVAPGLATVAYRVVQEALTNAARHAAGSRVEVTLEATGGQLSITVHDDGPGTSSEGGAGFGLVGLAERVRARGGTVAAGPAPGGGFRVSARLPLAPVAGPRRRADPTGAEPAGTAP